MERSSPARGYAEETEGQEFRGGRRHLNSCGGLQKGITIIGGLRMCCGEGDRDDSGLSGEWAVNQENSLDLLLTEKAPAIR